MIACTGTTLLSTSIVHTRTVLKKCNYHLTGLQIDGDWETMYYKRWSASFPVTF